MYIELNTIYWLIIALERQRKISSLYFFHKKKKKLLHFQIGFISKYLFHLFIIYISFEMNRPLEISFLFFCQGGIYIL